MRFLLTPEGMAEVPAACSHLIDQANCAEVLQYCSAGLNPDLCTAKLVFLHVTHGGSWRFPLDYAESIWHGGVKVVHFGIQVADFIFGM